MKEVKGPLVFALLLFVMVAVILYAPKEAKDCQPIQDDVVVNAKNIGYTRAYLYNNMTKRTEGLEPSSWTSDLGFLLSPKKWFKWSPDNEYRSDDTHQWWVCNVGGELKATLKKDN